MMAQTYLFAAAALAFVTGVVHAALGEILIFRHPRDDTLVPAREAPPLRPRHIGILWATWHLATLFGWAAAAVLLEVALAPASPRPPGLVAAIAAYAGAALLVLVGTRGRHPGWIALTLVAGMIGVAAVAS